MAGSTNQSIVTGLWRNARVAYLGTIDDGGVPHVSLTTLAPVEKGAAFMLLSDLARHSRNLRIDPRCSLLVTADKFAQGDVLAQLRVTAHGIIKHRGDNLHRQDRRLFVDHHSSSSDYIDFADFKIYCFQPTVYYLVGGFGRIDTIKADDIDWPSNDDH